jgi:hypothetical protein
MVTSRGKRKRRLAGESTRRKELNVIEPKIVHTI